jgi:hypothetical protein
VDDRDGDEAKRVNVETTAAQDTYLLDASAIPAKALYQAKKAARRPHQPPALMQLTIGEPPECWR